MSRDSASRDEQAAFPHKAYANLVGASVLLGSSFLLIHIAINQLDPLVVTWMRVAIGAALLCVLRLGITQFARADRVRLWCVAVLWMALPMTLVPLAQRDVSSGLAGMVSGATPLFATAVAIIVARQLPHWMHVAGIAVGGAGLAMLSLASGMSGNNGAMGFGLLLAAAVSYGVASNVAVPLLDRYGAIAVLRRLLVLAAVLTLPGAMMGLPRSTFGLTTLAATIVLGVLGTGAGFFFLFRLTELVGAARGSIASYLKAPVAFALGVAFLSEGVQSLEVLGCAVLLLGAWLSTLPDFGRGRMPLPTRSLSAGSEAPQTGDDGGPSDYAKPLRQCGGTEAVVGARVARRMD